MRVYFKLRKQLQKCYLIAIPEQGIVLVIHVYKVVVCSPSGSARDEEELGLQWRYHALTSTPSYQ